MKGHLQKEERGSQLQVESQIIQQNEDDPELEKCTRCKWSSSVAGHGKGWDHGVFKVVKTQNDKVTKICYSEMSREDGWKPMKCAVTPRRCRPGEKHIVCPKVQEAQGP